MTITDNNKTLEVFISIVSKKYPDHHFEFNIGMSGLFIYGEVNDGVYDFCTNLSKSMLIKIKIAYVKIEH